MPIQRIMIIGGAGSGKSSLAKKLGSISGLPVIHIDRIYWKPNWQFRERSEIAELTMAAASGDRWVFEGNFSETLPYRVERADMLIFLDISTPVRLWRVIKRLLLHYGRTRPDMAEGCVEHFDWAFLRWVASYRKGGRIQALRLYAEAPAQLNKHHLQSARAVDAFVAAFEREIK